MIVKKNGRFRIKIRKWSIAIAYYRNSKFRCVGDTLKWVAWSWPLEFDKWSFEIVKTPV